jgi:hypothetical protein
MLSLGSSGESVMPMTSHWMTCATMSTCTAMRAMARQNPERECLILAWPDCQALRPARAWRLAPVLEGLFEELTVEEFAVEAVGSASTMGSEMLLALAFGPVPARGVVPEPQRLDAASPRGDDEVESMTSGHGTACEAFENPLSAGGGKGWAIFTVERSSARTRRERDDKGSKPPLSSA